SCSSRWRAWGVLSELPIYIEDTPGLSISEVRSKARRLHAENGIDLVMIDYLQLMSGRRSDNRVQEVSEISRGLKALARELNVPLIALSQLSRAVEGRQSHVPMLSDLRESGCLTGESLVYLPDEGRYRRINALVGKTGFNVLAVNTEIWKLEPCAVTKAFCTGVKPVYRLTTRLGRMIRATGNHKFLTINGWQRLDSLAPGRHLALPRRLNSTSQVLISDTNRDVIPRAIWRSMVVPAMQTMAITTRRMQAAIDTAYCGTTLYNQSLSRERALHVAQAVGCDELRLLAESDVYWDEIVSIEPAGEEAVYDLTVDRLHNFIVNDIVSHNSIEQDADIVMFIYREELYDKDTDKKGIAEIHMAKHRNGPLGIVPLRFEARTTRFQNLERYRAPEGY
ncbi:replicative DNA helicase, partial [Candidatus Gracilibacteria bacterium]|nr:replicative DNA helicase [Candidatus Gracilibacteria bacterium]